eukprot:359576-Chlamydomonas_euryale.AAC.1
MAAFPSLAAPLRGGRAEQTRREAARRCLWRSPPSPAHAPGYIPQQSEPPRPPLGRLRSKDAKERRVSGICAAADAAIRAVQRSSPERVHAAGSRACSTAQQRRGGLLSPTRGAQRTQRCQGLACRRNAKRCTSSADIHMLPTPIQYKNAGQIIHTQTDKI